MTVVFDSVVVILSLTRLIENYSIKTVTRFDEATKDFHAFHTQLAVFDTKLKLEGFIVFNTHNFNILNHDKIIRLNFSAKTTRVLSEAQDL